MKFWAPVALVSALVASSLLSGCGASLTSEEASAPVAPSDPATTPIGTIQGTVYGGGVPVTGAKIFLYAANQANYGVTTAGAVQSRSKSLLNNNSSTAPVPCGTVCAVDTVITDITFGDTYVLTDSKGGFSISGDYKCSSGQQLYLFSLGGNPGYGGTNAAVGLLAALPNCPSTGTLAGQVGYIYMNEVSTVAMAYAVAGFAHDAVHIGASGNTSAQTGITNAFLNARNLYDIGGTTPGHSALPSGAVATNPATGVTRPQSTVDTLANILQYCVNTVDVSATLPAGISAACTNLFTAGTGTRTGAGNLGQTTGSGATVATADTATAAIFIAQHPGRNIATLYAYAITSATAYQPNLTAAPNDFTLPLVFTGGGLQSNFIGGENYVAGESLAIDAAGNAWQANNIAAGKSGNTVSAFSPLGVPLSPTGFPVGGYPDSVAIDQSGYAWIANANDNTISRLYATANGTVGKAIPGSPYDTSAYGYNPAVIRFDGSGHAWVLSPIDQTGGRGADLLELSSNGVEMNYYDGANTGQDLYLANGMAISPSGSVWVAENYVNSAYTAFNSSAVPIEIGAAPGAGDSTGPIAFDSSGDAWFAQQYGIGKVTSSYDQSEVAVPVPTAYLYALPQGIAVDGAGNVWYDAAGEGSIFEFTGSTETFLTPTYGYTCPGNSGYTSVSAFVYDFPDSLAIDASGDVWYRESSSTIGSLVELIGAAAPTSVPLSYAIAHSQIGSRP